MSVEVAALPFPRLRHAVPTDADRCAEIYLASRRATFTWVEPERFQLADYAESIKGEEVWVAELDGEVRAFASFFLPESFLHNLFVMPGWQRRGLGQALLGQVQRICPPPVRLKCLANNISARMFYQSMGWTEEGQGRSDLGFYVNMQAPVTTL
ncbi:GNAT family N-acetyltransferase [Lacibacterium aquatile]|uniref:GNAT family N-acetyltransferase n=1 Tax=Lacibacterium aquatile TaxID=1168082 RepID=A0ABW5DSB6_9PROT